MMRLPPLFALLAVCCTTPATAEVLSLPVPARTIHAGQPLAAGDFAWKSFNVNAIARANYVIILNQVLRMESLRVLPAGRPVALRAIKKTDDIVKGKPALARYVADGIEIQGTLTPLQSGSAGQIIEARNPESGRVLRVLVMADGTLAVPGQ